MPRVWRSDNLSAATHPAPRRRTRRTNRRFADVLGHYGATSTRDRAAGVAPKRHRREGPRHPQVGAAPGGSSCEEPRLSRRWRRTWRSSRKSAAGSTTASPRRCLRRSESTCCRSSTRGCRSTRRTPRRSGSGARSTSLAAFTSVPSRLIACEVEIRQYPGEAHRGLLPRPHQADGHDAAHPRRPLPPGRLPARHLVARPQAGRVCALPIPRGAVSLARLPARVRRTGRRSWRSCRR